MRQGKLQNNDIQNLRSRQISQPFQSQNQSPSKGDMIKNFGRRADSMDPNERVILNEARYSDHIEESQEQRKNSNAFNS